MDNRVSQAPNHGENHARNVILHFGSFNLWSDGNLEMRAAAAASLTNNAAAPPPQETSDKRLCLPENLVLDHGNLWGRNFYMNQGQEFARNLEQQSFTVFQDYSDSYVDTYNYKPEVLGCQSSIKHPSMKPLSSKYVKNNQLFLQDSNYRPDYGFSSITNNVVYTGFDYGSTSNSSSSSTSSLTESRPRFDLSLLQEILKGGDSVEISMLLLNLQGSYLDLMMDKTLSLVFKKLVSSCRGHQVDLIVEDVLLCSQSFITAAFCKQGASSICKLIKRVKRSSHAFSITQILSTQFWAIMTHEIARSVIQSCFDCFLQHNKVLYEQAILHCQELAEDKVGCRSLNELIEKISGEQRSRLLNGIAACSAELSKHQYGNYVVQNLLSLEKEGNLRSSVVLGLRGQFVELALQQGGSHVVEKCMEASNLGLVYVVKEIIETPKASLQLAQDLCGNYVIQKAFKETKERGLGKLYRCLMKSLEPYTRELNQTMSGKIVLGILKDEGGLKWPTSASANTKEARVWRRLVDATNKERLL